MSVRMLDISKATQPLAEYAKELDAGPIVVTVEGQPVAVVVAIENADLETISLSTNAQFLVLIERSRARHKSEGGISSLEMRRLLEIENADETENR